uniref:Ribosome biogenesis protein BOP1 n=2 Tax=Lygus hesperus TaxID=30085 RepID=A0A146KZP7_LYGHE
MWGNLAAESDSEDEPLLSRVGDIPLEWYDSEDHMGYDIYGNPIKHLDRGDGIDAFLRRADDPNAMRTIFDPLNNCNIILTDEELNMIHRLRHGKFPHKNFNPDEDYSAPITVRVEKLGRLYDSKKRFMPSTSETKKVLQLVNAIRNGWIRDPRLPPLPKSEPEIYDIWSTANDTATVRESLLPPPPLVLPGHDQSFSPPDEYLWTEDEYRRKATRKGSDNILVPQKYSNLW